MQFGNTLYLQIVHFSETDNNNLVFSLHTCIFSFELLQLRGCNVKYIEYKVASTYWKWNSNSRDKEGEELLSDPYKRIVRLSVVRDSDIPSWADFPPCKCRLTGRIKSGDVLIWSGGTGSGLPLIIEKAEALWAIAFLMGRRANRTGRSLIWNSS